MKTAAALLAIALLSLAGFAPRQATGGSSPCSLAQQALADAGRIQPGMTRREVEKYFAYDGGAQFPNNARYTYPKCNYIKVEVEFDVAPTRGSELTSPGDKVTKVSKLFIDYPVKD